MPHIRPSRTGDAELFAPKLREADMREVWAGTGEHPVSALNHGIRFSRPCLSAFDKRDPLCIYGLVPEEHPCVGRVWMLGTDALFNYSTAFLRCSRSLIDELHHYRPVLTNWIDSRNEKHLRWIKWCGFTLTGKSMTLHDPGVPFLEFVKVKDHVCTSDCSSHRLGSG